VRSPGEGGTEARGHLTPRPTRSRRGERAATAPPTSRRALRLPGAYTPLRGRTDRKRVRRCRGGARGSRITGSQARASTRSRSPGSTVEVGPGATSARTVAWRRNCTNVVPKPGWLPGQERRVSLDAKTAAADGSSRWITGVAHRRRHRLRDSESQAVVIGAGTHSPIARRSPLPTSTLPVDRQPLRVLLDARGPRPRRRPLFDAALAPTLVVTTEAAPSEAVDAWRAVRRESPRPSGRSGRCRPGCDARAVGRDGVLTAAVRRGPRRCTARCSPPGSSTASSRTSRQGPRPGRAPRVPCARCRLDRRAEACGSCSATPIDDDVASNTSPRTADVFTGIIESSGASRDRPPGQAARASRLPPRGPRRPHAPATPIAVNGCCLTVVDRGDCWWAAGRRHRDPGAHRRSARLERDDPV